MKLLNENKHFNDCIIEAFEESDENLIDVAEYMNDFIRDFFNMDNYDHFEGDNFKFFKYKEKTYKIEITDIGIVEITNNHKIIDWSVTIEEL